jgi:hypothetical protein
MSWRQKPEAQRHAAKPRKASEILRPLVVAPGQVSLDPPATTSNDMTVEVIRPAATAPRVQMKPRSLPLREQMGYGAAIVKSARPANAFRPVGGTPTAAVTASVSPPVVPVALAHSPVPAPVAAAAESMAAPQAGPEPAPTLDEPPVAPALSPPPPTSPTILADDTPELPDLAPDSADTSGLDAVGTVAAAIVVEPDTFDAAIPELAIPELAPQAAQPFARRRTDTVPATVAAEGHTSSRTSPFKTRVEPERPDRSINIPEFLRSLGVLPEQVSAEEMNARIEADLALDRLEALRQSRTLADGKAELAPFYIFPVEFWQTDPDLLLANSLGVWPSAPWNRAFLPLTVLGALSLNSVPHPRETTSDQFVFVDRVLGEAQAELYQLRPFYEQLSQDALFTAAGMNALIAKKRALEEIMKQAAAQYLFELRAKWHQSKGW